MKKIIFSVVLLTSLIIHAHAQQGSILLYGAVAYSSVTSNLGGSNKASAFAPGIGYQFSHDWTAGVDLSYAHLNDGTNSDNLLAVGPFLRYTKTISDLFSIYGQMDIHYDHNSFGSSGETPENGFDFKLFPAVFINLKKGFGLNFDFGGLEYQSLTQKPAAGFPGASNQVLNTFAFTFGEGITIGISKNFGGGK